MIKKGPVGAKIKTNHPSFAFYDGGVIKSAVAPDSIEDLTGYVTITGYGTDSDDTDFWTVRNSWGTDWGMDGYAKIARKTTDGNKRGILGINMLNFLPNVAM